MYRYHAFIDTTKEQDIDLGIYTTPDQAHSAINTYIAEHALQEGINCAGCIVEFHIED